MKAPGRTGKRSLIPGYYGAMGAARELRLQPQRQDDVRGGVGRSFGRVTVISGQQSLRGLHRAISVLQQAIPGVTPTFLLDQGLPAYPLPPRIDPSFSNNLDVDYWNGNGAMHPATYDTWTIVVAARDACAA